MRHHLFSHWSMRGFGFAALVGLLSFHFTAVARASGLNPIYAPDKAPDTKGIEATWQGTLHIPGHDLRTVVKITRSASSALAGQFFSIDQGAEGFPLSAVSFSGGVLKYTITSFDLSYEGRMSPDGNAITGTSTQNGTSFPLNFDRATPSIAWEMPTPPPPIKAMPANANPSFDVATIKPSKPDQPGKMFRVEGRHFTTLNTTLLDLIDFAYGTHPKQVVNAPPWMSTDKFDLSATPDAEGAPSNAQWKDMIQKLLADRFALKFHRDSRELSAYALTVVKTGSRMEKSQGDPEGLPGLFFSQPGNLHVNNANMEDFSHLMQEAVLDRPVVNQTDLKGRWNFNLKWTPDETQFAGMGMKIPPPTDAANAPAPLFTAIQEEIGLKLDATRTAIPVLVIDHVEKPSEN